ncbi:MAG: cobalamin biosynthesis protein CobQ [Clostridiales bacterium]|nr:cobalamin biosynthesis protein CobQ [Clostridiales bacterium]
MDTRLIRNLSVVAGHYGAGKTNFAVNLAIYAKTVFPGLPVHAADLDIVNPYFRTADAAPLLEENGIDPLIPAFANTNVDIPSLPPRMRGLIESKDDVTIVDVGGDDGAVALGMYREAILETGYSLFYVVNRFRPLIADPEDAVGCMIEIERASGLRCTALVNNSNLGAETTAKEIVESVAYGRECARRCALPLFCHVWCPALAPDTPEKMAEAGYADEPLFPIVNATKRLF